MSQAGEPGRTLDWSEEILRQELLGLQATRPLWPERAKTRVRVDTGGGASLTQPLWDIARIQAFTQNEMGWHWRVWTMGDVITSQNHSSFHTNTRVSWK